MTKEKKVVAEEPKEEVQIEEKQEKKTKIIGDFLGELQREIIEELALDGEKTFLAQGTLYTDLIESGKGVGSRADNIKSHHNVGGLPEKMNLKLLEPFRELFKDEVRELGKEMGIPNEIINRQPFPGPGLAIRILGNINRERLAILCAADKIILEDCLLYTSPSPRDS